ncbi:MAG: hypothetical protein IJN93_05705 [Clostridia bacterium]|nr:hypothetical protein [Clostridia bacterium]
MNSLFKSKPKNIIAICFTAFYTLMLILDVEFLQFPFITHPRYAVNSLVIYLVPLITPALVLIYLIFVNKEYKLKKWLFPIAFAVKIITAFLATYNLFGRLALIGVMPAYILLIFCSLLTLVATVFMFVGTLFNFKYIIFLKYGAISCAVLLFMAPVINYILFKAFAYMPSALLGVPDVGLPVLIETLIATLLYVGIFLLTTNKKSIDSI